MTKPILTARKDLKPNDFIMSDLESDCYILYINEKYNDRLYLYTVLKTPYNSTPYSVGSKHKLSLINFEYFVASLEYLKQNFPNIKLPSNNTIELLEEEEIP